MSADFVALARENYPGIAEAEALLRESVDPQRSHDDREAAALRLVALDRERLLRERAARGGRVLRDPDVWEESGPHKAADVSASRYRSGLQLVSSLALAERAQMRREAGGVRWMWDGIIRREGGLLYLLVSFPKVGKTTFAYRFIRAAASGDAFLGRPTSETKVLILAVEEPEEAVEDNVLDLLDGGHPNVVIHPAPLLMEDGALADVVTAVKEGGFGLVDVETLSSFWTVRDENDNAEVARQVGKLRNAARSSGVPWLVHAHTGKGEDATDGREIRGASALFGAVDCALILKRDGRGETTRRSLYGRGRFGNVPAILFDFDTASKTYTFIGSEAARADDEGARRVGAALRGEWETAQLIAERASMRNDVSRVRSILRVMEGVERQGKGVKGDPALYRLAPEGGRP